MSNPLAELSILLHLKVSKWDGQVSDDRALAAVASTFKSDTGRDKYRKSLFVNDPLKGVDRAAGRVRNNFYKWTLPWQDGGGRLVPSLNFRDFQLEHTKLVGDFDFEVNEFIAKYDELKDMARSHKGDLYREDDYPPASELYDRFVVSLQALPFPSTTDFRVEAPEEVIEDLKQNMDKTVIEVANTVAANVGAQLQERTARLYESLSSGKRFTQGLFDELKFVNQMAGSLKDVLPDNLVRNMALIDEHILSYDAEQVRHSDTLKQAVVKKSGDILKRLS